MLEYVGGSNEKKLISNVHKLFSLSLSFSLKISNFIVYLLVYPEKYWVRERHSLLHDVFDDFYETENKTKQNKRERERERKSMILKYTEII